MHAAPSLLNRICAALLLGSVLVGVLAPGAVAMSRTDIQQAAGQEGLASDVQDFLNGVLEDAMLRAANVAPSTTASTDTPRPATERSPFLVVSPGLMEAGSATIRSANHIDEDACWGPVPSIAARSGPISPRAP